MKQLLITVNSASHEHPSGTMYRYYIDGKRVTKEYYCCIENNTYRQDSFLTTRNGHITRHYKSVYM
jgi:hypothetical protein